jgi:dolichol kinase
MTQKIFADMALNDAVLVIIAFMFILAVIGTSMILKKKGVISKHTARKLVHLLAGFSCFIVPFLYIPGLALILSLLFLIVTRLSNPKTKIFDTMGEKDESETGYLAGPFCYALSINVLVAVFSFMPQYFFFPAASIMVMMIADTAASYFGRRYGKHKITMKYTKTTRSVEGCLAMLASGFGLSLFAFAFFGSWFPGNDHNMSLAWIVILAGLVAVVSMVMEIISPSDWDDFVVPIAGCFVSFLLTVLLFPASIGIV